MTQNEKDILTILESTFDAYVRSFYTDDDFINANLKLKEDHSKRVLADMNILTEMIDLDPTLQLTAHAAALFHDIARFEQFTKYRTYNDWNSFDHSRRGAEILREKSFLEPLTDTQRKIVITATCLHGQKQLPDNLEPTTDIICKLTRDADKLDIYHVVTEQYKKYFENPNDFLLELEFPDTPGFTPEVVDDISKGLRIEYTKLKTLNDMRLLQMAWVYDVNFTATLKLIRQRKLLEKIADQLPPCDTADKITTQIYNYVDKKIAENTGQIEN